MDFFLGGGLYLLRNLLFFTKVRPKKRLSMGRFFFLWEGHDIETHVHFQTSDFFCHGLPFIWMGYGDGTLRVTRQLFTKSPSIHTFSYNLWSGNRSVILYFIVQCLHFTSFKSSVKQRIIYQSSITRSRGFCKSVCCDKMIYVQKGCLLVDFFTFFHLFTRRLISWRFKWVWSKARTLNIVTAVIFGPRTQVTSYFCRYQFKKSFVILFLCFFWQTAKQVCLCNIAFIYSWYLKYILYISMFI